jgi:hypothetical protein
MIEEIVVGYLTPLVQIYENVRSEHVDSEAKLGSMVKVGLSSLVGSREELLIVHNEWAHVRELERIASLQSAVDDMWLATITEGVEAGVFRDDHPPKLVYRTIMGGLESVIRWFDPQGPATIEDVAHLQVDLLMGGLRAAN